MKREGLFATKKMKENKKAPKKECEDKKCPFHGNTVLRGRTFVGVIMKKDTHKTATVEWYYKLFVPKYERYETRRTRIHVHNPPCIDANIGDRVKVAEARPISKTKNFVIIENLGKEKGFEEKLEAEEEAKEVIEKKERKKGPEETEEEKKEAKIEKKLEEKKEEGK